MEKKEVSISCQLIYKNYGDGYKFHVSTPKTDAGIRKIPMSETVYKAFAAQKRQNFLQRIPRNVEIEGRTDFIFMSKNGRPLMPSAVNNVLYNIVAAYNKQETEQAKKEKREADYMPSISAHTLRHTGCTRMAEQGLDMKVVQYIMGHANIGVTMKVYNHKLIKKAPSPWPYTHKEVIVSCRAAWQIAKLSCFSFLVQWSACPRPASVPRRSSR